MAANRDETEMMCSMATLILASEKMDITADNIAKVLDAAGAKYEPYWPGLFAGALKDVDVDSLMATATAAPAAAGPATGAAAAAAPAAEEKVEEKKEPEEEEDEDMGFSLFD